MVQENTPYLEFGKISFPYLIYHSIAILLLFHSPLQKLRESLTPDAVQEIYFKVK